MTKKPSKSRSVAGISATDAARNFSDLLNRVRYRRQIYVVERGGEAVCEIRPVYHAGGFTGADLVRLLCTLPDAPQAYLEAVTDAIERQPPAEETRWPR